MMSRHVNSQSSSARHATTKSMGGWLWRPTKRGREEGGGPKALKAVPSVHFAVSCSLFPSFFVANFLEDYIRCCALYHDRNDEESSRSKPNGMEVK
jgi:hypothetical protein